MLTACEHGRLVKAGAIPHPVSWSGTLSDQLKYAHLAQYARDKLRPYTTAEHHRQTDAEWVAYDTAKDATRWPDWDVVTGEAVVVNGLASRPDLEAHTATVVGVCYKTKRIGIQLDGSKERISVLIERLTPIDDEYLAAAGLASLHI